MLQSSSPSLCDYSGSLSPVWLLPPLQPTPVSQTLTSGPLVALISPPAEGSGGCGFMRAVLWGTIRSYHHREAVLWRAEGRFWTTRFMEITDQCSDWQATDCTGLSGSWLMGADGFWSWCPAGCMYAARMVSGPANAALQYCTLFVLCFSSPSTVGRCDLSFVRDVFV